MASAYVDMLGNLLDAASGFALLVLKWTTRLVFWPVLTLVAIGYGSHLVIENKRNEMATESAEEFGPRQQALGKRVEAEIKKVPPLAWRFRMPDGERIAHGTGLAIWMESAEPDLSLLMMGYGFDPVRLLRSQDADRSTLNTYSGLGGEFMVQGGTLVPLDAEHILFSGGHSYFLRPEREPALHTLWKVGPYHPVKRIPMQQQRAFHVAAKAPAGEIVILGGESPLRLAEDAAPAQPPATKVEDPTAFLPTSAVERVDLVNGISVIGAPLLQARSRFSAVPLPGGKLLLAGGMGEKGHKGAALGHTEIYDLATGISTAGTALHQARHSHSALALRDGAVIVAGGLQYDPDTDRQDRLDSVEIWQDNTWKAAPRLHFPRLHPVIVELEDGGVMVYGGGFGYVEVWDRTSDRWQIVGWDSASATLALPIDGERLASLSPAYLPLYLDPNAKLKSHASTADVEITRVERARVPIAGQLSLGRVAGAAIELRDGRLLVTGGHLPTLLPEDPVHRDGVLNQMEIYDVRKERSNATGQLSHRRYGHQSFLLPDGRVAVLGGRARQSPDEYEPVLSIEVIDPKALTSKLMTATDELIERPYRAVQEPDGNILLVEDADEESEQAASYRWHWREDRMEPLNPLPALHRAIDIIVLGPTRILVLGTRKDGDAIDTALQWNPVALTTVALPAPPRPITPTMMLSEPDLGYVGILGKEAVLVWDAVAGAWLDRTNFFKSITEEPGEFAPPVVAHIGRGQLLCTNVVPPNPHLGYQGGRPGIVDLFSGQSLGTAHFDAPGSPVAGLRHSSGRLYYVGHPSGWPQHNNSLDRHAGVAWFMPPQPRVSLTRWLRQLETWWSLRADWAGSGSPTVSSAKPAQKISAWAGQSLPAPIASWRPQSPPQFVAL